MTLVDIDEDALEIAKKNVQNYEISDKVDFIRLDVEQIPESFNKKFDLVLTNPPFGIRSKKSADINFLKEAINVIFILNQLILKISTQFIYSLHKFETFQYLKSFYNKNGITDINGFKIEYDLPKTYKFHKKGKTKT